MAEKGKRGFAGMDQEKQRAIASKGGKAAHQKGTAHEFTPEEARAAGRKGGQAAHERGRAHQFTSEEARIAGRKGGQHSRASRNSPAPPPEPQPANAAVPESPAEAGHPNHEHPNHEHPGAAPGDAAGVMGGLA